MKRISCSIALITVLACQCLASATQQPEKEVEIAGLPTLVLSENDSRLGSTWFVEVYLARGLYSRDNIILIWRYYCEKYPDTKYKLDVRIFTEKPQNTNATLKEIKPRRADAWFVRMGNGAAAGGGENELLIYSPDLDKPEEKKREVFAGRDPIP